MFARSEERSTMSQPRDRDPDRQLQFLRDFLDENAWIDGDVVEIGNGAWAIHGVIPYDLEVLMAEFDTCDAAKHVLDQLGDATRPAINP
jgi:hypothetical protein